MQLYKPLLVLAGCVLLFSFQTSQHNKAGVEAAMRYYDHLILSLDADSIALLYTPDGKMGDVAKGRDSIRHFLSSFKNIQVLSQHSTSDSVLIKADTALQKGS